METKIITKNELKEAAAIIRDGGIVAMPTETVYGLAANALDTEAVQKIFEAKGRQADNPLIVHIANISDWSKLVTDLPEKAKLLAERFWPGPLTIILKKSDLVPDIVTAGLDTVAVRMPKNKIAFRFIKECGVPLAAPSANLSGSPSPTKFNHVLEDMNGRIDAIINGGDCMVGVESTVISLAEDTPIILRPGRITAEQIQKVIGSVDIHETATKALDNTEAAASPGMKYKHYAPQADLRLVDGDDKDYTEYIQKEADEQTAVICFDEMLSELENYKTFSLGSKNDPVTQAKRLFDVLRSIDEQGFTKAFAPVPDAAGVGLAVLNRLLRASGFRVENLQSKTVPAIEKPLKEELPQAEQPQNNTDEDAEQEPTSYTEQSSVTDEELEDIIGSFASFEEDSAILALNDIQLNPDFNEDFSKEICDNITVVEKTSEEDPTKIFYEASLDGEGARPAAYPVDDIDEDFQFDVYDDDLKPKRRGLFARIFGKKEEPEEPEPFLPLPNRQWNSLAPIKRDGEEGKAREEELQKLNAEISGKTYEKIPGIRVIGITGKTGSGKTFIAKRMAEKTSRSMLINADHVYHEMIKEDSLVLSLVVAFGNEILDGKQINRKVLAKLAFASEESLDKLNKTVLPAVAERIISIIEDARTKGVSTVYLDAPTLIESGLNQVCNEVIFIMADPAVRQERIVARDNITLDEIGQRMRFEKEDAFYVRFADRIIRNN
ncbi:MAG: threonylcarbamoyl-AMP synthase [Clostridia bacterium]|nr:threonylcarbamoyl-AMP synthase [Clostridia bacterium]